MRAVLLLLAVSACSNSSPPPAPAPPPTPFTTTSKLAKPLLVLDHITLLEPEAVLDARLTDRDAFAARLKTATAYVSDWDAAHPGKLPAELDVILTLRPTGLRVWLVGAAGDVAPAPDLAAKLTTLAAVPVKDGYVGAVATMVRSGGDKPAARAPFLPAAWKAAAGSAGGALDEVIAAAWPL